MLTLFTNITAQLTDLEKNTLTPMLCDTPRYTHEDSRITGKNISHWFKASGHDIGEARIRKLINYIRVTNAMKPKVLIGASNGYFITSSICTIQDQIHSLEGRIDSMKAVIESLIAQKQNLQKV